jgi:hypothetical protein
MSNPSPPIGESMPGSQARRACVRNVGGMIACGPW